MVSRKPDGMSGSMDELFWPQPDGQSVHYGAAGRDVCCQRFEHSIANMFMIPMGIVIRDFASPEFWTAVGSAPENFFSPDRDEFHH